MANKYVSPSRLSIFLDNLKSIFSPLIHTHKLTDISDLVIDSELSSTSTNPVQNRVLDAEFEAISQSFDVLELAIDEKAGVFIGTYAEYQTAYANGQIPINTFVILTDDETSGGDSGDSGDSSGDSTSTSTSSLLGTGALGYMILG